MIALATISMQSSLTMILAFEEAYQSTVATRTGPFASLITSDANGPVSNQSVLFDPRLLDAQRHHYLIARCRCEGDDEVAFFRPGTHFILEVEIVLLEIERDLRRNND